MLKLLALSSSGEKS